MLSFWELSRQFTASSKNKGISGFCSLSYISFLAMSLCHFSDFVQMKIFRSLLAPSDTSGWHRCSLSSKLGQVTLARWRLQRPKVYANSFQTLIWNSAKYKCIWIYILNEWIYIFYTLHAGSFTLPACTSRTSSSTRLDFETFTFVWKLIWLVLLTRL